MPSQTRYNFQFQSATEHIAVEPLTKPAKVSDPVSGLTAKLKIVISATCPANLLRKNGMKKLKIGIKPIGKGMTAVRLTKFYFPVKQFFSALLPVQCRTS